MTRPAPRKKPSTDRPAAESPAGGLLKELGYRIGDFPMHYFAAIQRQNQINLGHALRAVGMSVPMWRALSALDDDAGMTIGQLAELTVLDRSSLGRLLEDMAAEGLVARESAPDDRRALLVRRTTAGKRRFAAALPILKEHYRRLLRGVSDDEFKVLMGLLRRIKANSRMMSDLATDDSAERHSP